MELFLFTFAAIGLGLAMAANRRTKKLQAQVTEFEWRIQRLESERPVKNAVAPLSSAAPAPAPSPAPPPAVPIVFPKIVESTFPNTVPPSIPKPLAETPPPFVETAAHASEPPISKIASIQWEQFIGARLFAWIGGLVLFLCAAYFVKYSFDNNLIPPAMRVSLGFILGVGLVISGTLLASGKYSISGKSFCATGVIILYGVTFACRSIYHFEFFGPAVTFAMMALITATAFVLAVRLEARVVAVLGIAGGFLTPILLSTGEDHPVGLFGYIALLDLGLLAVALRKRWSFIALLGAIGTVAMEFGWTGRFFAIGKLAIAVTIYSGFTIVFAIAFTLAARLQQTDRWHRSSLLAVCSAAWLFTTVHLLGTTFSGHPLLFLAILLATGLSLVVAKYFDEGLDKIEPVTAGSIFLTLMIWTSEHVDGRELLWTLGATLFFAVAHSVLPMMFNRVRGRTRSSVATQLFPLLGMVLLLMTMLRLDEISWLVWPAILLMDALIIGIAAITFSVGYVLIALLATMVAALVWTLRIPLLDGISPLLVVVVGAGLLFFVIGTIVAPKLAGKKTDGSNGGRLDSAPWQVIPVSSIILPFVLLIMIAERVPMVNPSAIFGVGLLFLILLGGLSVWLSIDLVLPFGLGCVAALEVVWHFSHYLNLAPIAPLGWYFGFWAAFAAFPFLFAKRFSDRILPWITSALSAPIQFFLVYRVIRTAFPNGYMGLVPGLFALLVLIQVALIIRVIKSGPAFRVRQLVWFGAVALLFISLIFPIQFEREWLTIGWALEGVALLWLFHRLKHDGLRLAAFALLCVGFARLALNIRILDYHVRSGLPIWNWYLYTYGIVIICLFAAANMLRSPNQSWKELHLQGILYSMGAVLTFILMNIEIADYFSTGSRLTFDFSGNFARDMTYSITWALFGMVVLVLGLRKRISAARYGAIGLIAVTLVKLFFHDLSQLAQLYRIGALFVVAVVLFVASFLYQKLLSGSEEATEKS